MPTDMPPHVFIRVSIPAEPESIYAQIKNSIAPTCVKDGGPIVIGLQVYDLVNTQRHWEKDPYRVEVDPWNRMFAGKSRRNIVGIILGTGLLDLIKMKLTQHSPVLRCAAMFNQATTNLQEILLSNGVKK